MDKTQRKKEVASMPNTPSFLGLVQSNRPGNGQESMGEQGQGDMTIPAIQRRTSY